MRINEVVTPQYQRKAFVRSVRSLWRTLMTAQKMDASRAAREAGQAKPTKQVKAKPKRKPPKAAVRPRRVPPPSETIKLSPDAARPRRPSRPGAPENLPPNAPSAQQQRGDAEAKRRDPDNTQNAAGEQQGNAQSTRLQRGKMDRKKSTNASGVDNPASAVTRTKTSSAQRSAPASQAAQSGPVVTRPTTATPSLPSPLAQDDTRQQQQRDTHIDATKDMVDFVNSLPTIDEYEPEQPRQNQKKTTAKTRSR